MSIRELRRIIIIFHGVSENHAVKADTIPLRHILPSKYLLKIYFKYKHFFIFCKHIIFTFYLHKSLETINLRPYQYIVVLF